MKVKESRSNPNDEIIKGYIRNAQHAKTFSEKFFKSSEAKRQQANSYISSWLDSELSRRDQEEKQSSPPPKKTRKVSYDQDSLMKTQGQSREDIFEQMEQNLLEQMNVVNRALKAGGLTKQQADEYFAQIRRDSSNLNDSTTGLQSNKSELPKSFVREVTKSNASGTGSLPPKKRTFIDLTQEEPSLVSESYRIR